jgi:beta-aspartyl-peptidase (threonine type)
MSRAKLTPEKEAEYREALKHALTTAEATLVQGGSSIDAVVAAINTMEDSPLFNAGKGAVFTNIGTNEFDASIMNGADLQAGAVASVKNIKNPIALARAVMDHSPHVMLVGAGAEAFAEIHNIERADAEYFYTERRWQSLQKVRARQEKENAGGTVGVVILDTYGNLAAGTSTGGMTNKRWGRVGDSPIIGAGTYASNKTCAVSATGHGEYFIRLGMTRSISMLMEYNNMTLQQAADLMIQEKLTDWGGTGGVVAVDHNGNVAFSFNTSGMYRGYLKQGAEPVVAIFKE